MRKQYDDFTQLKLKDMSKCISDMTYTFINPETHVPTVVPASHYEKILGQIKEAYIGAETNQQILNIVYNQLVGLKKEYEKQFYQSLICMDLGINPKDLRIDNQIALGYIYDYIDDRRAEEKKDFHFLDSEIIDTFDKIKNDPTIQAQAVRESNRNRHKERNGREL